MRLSILDYQEGNEAIVFLGSTFDMDYPIRQRGSKAQTAENDALSYLIEFEKEKKKKEKTEKTYNQIRDFCVYFPFAAIFYCLFSFIHSFFSRRCFVLGKDF